MPPGDSPNWPRQTKAKSAVLTAHPDRGNFSSLLQELLSHLCVQPVLPESAITLYCSLKWQGDLDLCPAPHHQMIGKKRHAHAEKALFIPYQNHHTSYVQTGPGDEFKPVSII